VTDDVPVRSGHWRVGDGDSPDQLRFPTEGDGLDHRPGSGPGAGDRGQLEPLTVRAAGRSVPTSDAVDDAGPVVAAVAVLDRVPVVGLYGPGEREVEAE